MRPGMSELTPDILLKTYAAGIFPMAERCRALEEYVIEGIETTIPLHQRLIAEPDFVNGDYDIHWLENWIEATT